VADKNDKVKQPNAIQRWYRETMGELRKVSWPTRQEAQRLTGIVVAVMVAMSLLLGLLDFIFSSLVKLILS
jgi:preprotein translocase subunit SecE